VGILYGETINIASPSFARLTDDRAILEQAILMRLETRRGTLPKDPEYGLLLTDYINAEMSAETLTRIPAEVQHELEKDQRIQAVTVVPRWNPGSSLASARLYLEMYVTPKEGPSFSLTLAVSQVSVQVLTKG